MGGVLSENSGGLRWLLWSKAEGLNVFLFNAMPSGR